MSKMIKMNMVGMVLVAVSATLVALLAMGVGETAAFFVGKAVWYLPYVGAVGAVWAFRAAARV